MSRGLEYRGDVMEIGSLYDIDELRELGGIVDYVVGTPLTKVYVPRRAPRSEAAALPRALQDGGGPALSVLHPVPPRPLRGPVRHRPRRALPRLRRVSRSAAPLVEVCAVAKRDLEAGRDARRVRHVHDVRRGRQFRRDESAAVTCPKVSSTVARCGATVAQGRGAHLRRRRRCPPDAATASSRAVPHFRGETWLERAACRRGLTRERWSGDRCVRRIALTARGAARQRA